jgi:hypothetical protein
LEQLGGILDDRLGRSKFLKPQLVEPLLGEFGRDELGRPPYDAGVHVGRVNVVHPW